MSLLCGSRVCPCYINVIIEYNCSLNYFLVRQCHNNNNQTTPHPTTTPTPHPTTSTRFFPRLPSTPLAFSTTARRLLLLHSRDRRVERDGRGDALTHARRQTRHAWVVLTAALQPGRGALRSSPLRLRCRRSASLSRIVSSVAAPCGASERRACIATGDARASRAVGGSRRHSRAGPFARATVVFLLLLVSRPVAGRRPRLAPSLRPPLRA